MGTINELEALAEKKFMEARKLKDRADRLKEEEELPGLRKKYEGKFFRYKNSYGQDESWPLYSYCQKVTGLRTATVHKFQSAPSGHEFSIKSEFFHTFQTQISKAEWNKALKRFKAKVERLGKI